MTVPDLPNPVTYAIPAFVALIVVEMLVVRRRDRTRYEPADTIVSLAMGLGSTVAGALAAGAVAALFALAHDWRVATIPFAWWAWALCVVLDDLAYYVFHRSAHRVRWFWASHVNHHSSQHYNLTTALRQTWTGFIAGSFLFRVPLVLIGFHPAMVVFVGGVNLIYQFWIHTEAIGRMPRWFEAVMNTPSHHRVHHAVNPRYLDRNYAGMFIVWDRLFGTYTPERDDDRPRYGLVHQLGRWSILRVAFHEWIAIARDVRRAPWRAKLHYLVKPPGWSHDGSRETSDMIRRRWQETGAWTNMTSSSSAADRAAPPPPASSGATPA